MRNRRQFLRDAALASGAFGSLGGLLESVARAAAIGPEEGSTFLDAEHIVVLMQENRSFDHAFGTLRGVRGFGDPRAIRLPNGDPVWVQANAVGEKYVPFHLDIAKTKTTWMGCLPHGWADQVDAANGGKHDRWLRVKQSGKKEYAKMPLTLGYHTRADIPFYYALADAFTICDQHFCSTLTGTTPNRLHLWTGTIRTRPTTDVPALVRNQDCDYGSWQNWTTFPERLEAAGVSWKVYQNELTVPTGLAGEADAWLSNFGCNPLEWFTQFNVRLAPQYLAYIRQRVAKIPAEITATTKQIEVKSGDAGRLTKRLADLKSSLARYKKDLAEFTPEALAKLSPRDKSLHERAFCTNAAEPSYRSLADLHYREGDVERKVKVPKGDVLYQFRKDVNEGKLPAVSWLVAPERLSDHPDSAWYGQWYLSEVLNILTHNPEVWKKTVFILTYDENDGYFDHVPPFQAPHPAKPETGRASAGIDTSLDHLELEADRKHHPGSAVRGNSLGLGFRVPMIIASPWSRGGCICSQVFDHTSVIQFMEKMLTHKTGKAVHEPNITRWRRTVCGDLTAAFQAGGDARSALPFVDRDSFVEAIHKAQYKDLPSGFHPLSAQEVEQVNRRSPDSPMPRQEPGVRPSSPLPYELSADGELLADQSGFRFRLAADNHLFGQKAAGAPFIVYAVAPAGVSVRHYTVAAGTHVEDSWPLADFQGGPYHFRAHGPNGFFREFTGNSSDSPGVVRASSLPTGGIQIDVSNKSAGAINVTIRDNAYGHAATTASIPAGKGQAFTFDNRESQGWYDLTVVVGQAESRYAGRVETGRWGISDPQIGGR